jgi:hypothetical protein
MSSLTMHAKEILLHPKEEWRVIDGEQETVGGLYRKYIVPLAAIGPVAAFIGWSVFGLRVPYAGRYRLPVGTALLSGIVRYMLALVGVFVIALIIDTLAPRFGGTSNRIQALKIAAYGSTAAWLAGAFSLVPALAVLGILGLYSLYIVYVGLPILMKAPQDKAAVYTAAVVALAIVVFAVFGWISTLFVRFPTPGSLAG